jgi:hypothetical protein
MFPIMQPMSGVAAGVPFIAVAPEGGADPRRRSSWRGT